MRRTASILVICVFVWLTTASADEVGQRALAEELVNAMEMQKGIENSFEMIKQMIPAQMEQMSGAENESSEEVQARVQIMMDYIAKEMSWDNLKEDYISIYAETFTEEELAGLVEFYKSPVGRKFTEKQPELMKRAMEISQKQMMEIMPKMRKFAEEMKEKEEKEAARTGDGENK